MMIMKKSAVYLLLLLAMQVVACTEKNTVEIAGKKAVSQDTDSAIAQVDDSVQSFMLKHNVPGVSLAIVKNGKLVYAKGYGYADQSTSTPVTTTSKFRISSISKSITSAAIMKLLGGGQLTLDDKVFGPGAILGTQYGTLPYGPYITDLTVRHMLQHYNGGWSNASSDPTLTNVTMNAEQLITWILNNRPLTSAPGTTYLYSNVGYMTLGRVIEELTGQTYENYVKTNVLAPSGITNMEIGGSTLLDRKTDEVVYYGQGGQNPYGQNFPRRDANGGWIASASDMMRLMVHVDGLSTVPDILTAALKDTMITPYFANQAYACGWSISAQGSWYHSGSFPGSSSFWMRRNDGMSGIALVNSQSTNATFSNDLLQLVQRMLLSSTIAWPTVDLF